MGTSFLPLLRSNADRWGYMKAMNTGPSQICSRCDFSVLLPPTISACVVVYKFLSVFLPTNCLYRCKSIKDGTKDEQ